MKQSKRSLKHGSLFSGIGGFDLAAEWMGWKNIFQCEMDPFCQVLLKYYYPNAAHYGDIKTTDFREYRGKIDVLSGGFPCQPYSIAGKRLGRDDERHLWPNMLRAIREIRPRWVVGENVRGIISWENGLVFEQVQADLEAEGYNVQPYVLPAAGLNAPHRRDRVWFIANTRSNGHGSGRPDEDRYQTGEDKSTRDKRQRVWDEPDGNGTTGDSAHTNSIGRDHGSDPGQSGHFQNDKWPAAQDQPEREERERWPGTSNAAAADTGSPGLEGQTAQRIQAGCRKDTQNSVPESSGNVGAERWQHFPQTQPTICVRNDGVPDPMDFDAILANIPMPKRQLTFSKWRMEALKALGNAIVPQIAYQIFSTIQQMVNLKSSRA